MESAPVKMGEGGLTRRRMLGLLGCGGALLAAGLADPAAAADDKCKVITGTVVETLTADGCTSPVGFCAGGTFEGNHGFRGHSYFTALAFDPIPSDPLGRLVVPGESVYTTKDGRITLSLVFAFDPARGTFAATGRIVGGTGSLAGATGDAIIYGRFLPDGITIRSTFVLELCLP